MDDQEVVAPPPRIPLIHPSGRKCVRINKQRRSLERDRERDTKQLLSSLFKLRQAIKVKTTAVAPLYSTVLSSNRFCWLRLTFALDSLECGRLEKMSYCKLFTNDSPNCAPAHQTFMGPLVLKEVYFYIEGFLGIPELLPGSKTGNVCLIISLTANHYMDREELLTGSLKESPHTVTEESRCTAADLRANTVRCSALSRPPPARVWTGVIVFAP